MMKHAQNLDALRRHLQEQIDFIITSCNAYDNGKESEAKRIAVQIRILIHDTKHSLSLLSQLKLKDIQFIDSAPNPNGNLLGVGLCGLNISPSGTKYYPRLDNAPKEFKRAVTFDEWWNYVVIRDSHGNDFTRKEIILYVADQDGGAHVDPELSSRYYLLSRLNSVKFYDNGKSIGNPVPPTIRQIAHELLQALRVALPS